MMVTRIEQIAMDLIRTEDHVMAKADLRNPLQLLLCIDPAHRIVGIAEDQDLGLRVNRLLKIVEIDLIGIPLFNQGRIIDRPAMHHRVVNKMKIDRGLNQHFISRMGEGMVSNVEAGDQTGQERRCPPP